MKWKDRSGQIIDIDRKKAREMDIKDGREHMPRTVVDAVTAIQACTEVIRTHRKDVERWGKKAHCWRYFAPVQSLLQKFIDGCYEIAKVQQCCAIQHNTQNAYVNISAHPGKEDLAVPERDLSKLVCAARGGLRDEHGVSANCYSCPHWDKREAWQNCELYHLINSIPCSTYEEEQLVKNACPYALGRFEFINLTEEDLRLDDVDVE